jgi:hypothetical protein
VLGHLLSRWAPDAGSAVKSACSNVSDAAQELANTVAVGLVVVIEEAAVVGMVVNAVAEEGLVECHNASPPELEQLASAQRPTRAATNAHHLHADLVA